MTRIKLPIVLKKPCITFPAGPMCPWCGRNRIGEPHSMAILNAGSLRPTGEDSATMASDNLAFFALHWHGAHTEDGGTGIHPDTGAMVDIVQTEVGGQFDLDFCSPACLRAFLNHCVDELERAIAGNEAAGGVVACPDPFGDPGSGSSGATAGESSGGPPEGRADEPGDDPAGDGPGPEDGRR